ncbi:Chymotrypsin BI [Frankliniella fusca]|uniref:Chymotrypsin BI n=1 Tax=Frankliniella fusca TaxID=407009 RepID=A0AAE1HFG4_9NEOP|nr:Chymotrypsin BI [Frankliniella fusca]
MLKMDATLVVLLALGLTMAAATPVQYESDLDNALDSALDEDLDLPTNLRMAGGKIVPPGNDNYRFMVAIQPQYVENGATLSAPVCSGVLIAGFNRAVTPVTPAYWVLTSAHCALSGTSYQLFVGNNKITTQAANETITAADAPTRVTINSEYRESMLTGDLALISVTSIVPNTVSGPGGLTAARLSTVSDASKSFLINPVTMAGWGYPNDVFNGPSPSLRELTSWVVPNWYCAVRHLTLPVRRTHMCTAGLPNKGPCTGDSGAPLLATIRVNGTDTVRVVGLATHTPRDGCSRGKPGVFTRIGDYLDWIVQVTGYDADTA